MMLLAIRMFKYLRYFPSVSFMNATIWELLPDLIVFLALLALILVCFAAAGIYYFGEVWTGLTRL